MQIFYNIKNEMQQREQAPSWILEKFQRPVRISSESEIKRTDSFPLWEKTKFKLFTAISQNCKPIKV
jgi:hypothetical protein